MNLRNWLTAGLLLALLSGCAGGDEPKERNNTAAGDAETLSAADTTEARYDSYGFRVDNLQVSERQVRRNESLYLILDGLGFSRSEIYRITSRAENHIDFSDFKPGQDYRVYTRTADSSGGPVPAEGAAGEAHLAGEPATSGPSREEPSDDAPPVERLVWQSSDTDYVVFEFSDSLRIYRDAHEVVTRTAKTSAEITSSLYMAVTGQGASQVLAYKMSDVLAWEIDFFNLRDGDSFEVYYENTYVNGEYRGVGDILAIEFTHMGETHQAYRFAAGETEGFYDGEGNSVQKALLKAPFRYNQRISSGFNPRRFHPVLKERRPHNGVDYAAPHGTPVLSTGAGTVVEAGYRGANGNWVKIRHNGTFDTAYLHLSGFASGIRRGATVDQGEVIGYVGATGRVTGTHLHYQLYRNGSPVNPLTIDLPSSESVPQELLDEFMQRRNELRAQLLTLEHPHPILSAR
ncbi:MAG: peptidoglycan DD-metalloendopeptidase family protein [Balneolaceae bacterium]|nr:peptidoglycan DD-metalloendopeptidase family protein [Balneolaceae bacterium]